MTVPIPLLNLKLRFLPAIPGNDALGKVNRSGDTMIGPLTLFGDPTQPLHAATKQYVDAAIGSGTGIGGSSNLFVFKDAVNGVITKPITGDDLPACTNLTLGAVKAKPQVANQVLVALDEGGAFTSQQPTTANLAAWGIRERLLASRNYFVDHGIGMDSNDGRQATVGAAGVGPFLTIQKAIDVAAGTLDLNTFAVTINVAAGTYTMRSPTPGAGEEPVIVCKPYIGAGPIAVVGAGIASTILNVLAGNAITVNACPRYTFFNMRIVTAGAGNVHINVLRTGQVDFSGIDFGPTNAGTYITATSCGIATCTGNCTISGACTTAFNAAQNANLQLSGRTFTFVGSPGLAIGTFASCIQSALIVANGMVFSPATLAFTGQRFNVTTNGTIDTFTGGLNYFPGTIAGVADTATGGVYA